MNIWSVIVVGLQSLTNWSGHVIGACLLNICCDIWPSFDENILTFVMWWVVNDDLMFSWYYIFPFSELRNVVLMLNCRILHFFKFFYFRWTCWINAVLSVVFLLMKIGKVVNLKLNFVESVICFEFLNVVGLTFSFL